MPEGYSNIERRSEGLTSVDELFLERACELAERGIGNTAPNPPVGAVLVRDGRIVGEGYHHRAGEAHAEVLALREAAERAQGATLYVSLEPCGHVGRTPPCTRAIVEAGVVRVVAGTRDPSGRGGTEVLRGPGIEVVDAAYPQAAALIEVFGRSQTLRRPFVALKMAMSLDGFVASRPGVREQLTGEATRRYVRELRVTYDAVMVGAGTVRVDDPILTVRPAHHRLRPYVRIVLCERAGVPPESRVFARESGYAPTIVVAPAAVVRRFQELRNVAEVIAVGSAGSERLDLVEALETLREREIYSVLCEGGPTLAARLVAGRQVDRFFWAMAPRFLHGPAAVPVLAAGSPLDLRLRYDRIEALEEDVLLSGVVADV